MPKTVAPLIPIVSEYYILKSDIPTELKLSLNIPVAMYVAVAIIISYFFGQDYHFNSLDKNKLERIKRIKKYLDNNINILDDVDVKDFEWHIANINDDLQIPEEFKKQKKLQKKLYIVNIYNLINFKTFRTIAR